MSRGRDTTVASARHPHHCCASRPAESQDPLDCRRALPVTMFVGDAMLELVALISIGAAIAAAPLSVLWLAGRGKWQELNQARPRLRPTTRQITRGRPGPPGVWTGLEGDLQTHLRGPGGRILRHPTIGQKPVGVRQRSRAGDKPQPAPKIGCRSRARSGANYGNNCSPDHDRPRVAAVGSCVSSETATRIRLRREPLGDR